MDWSMDGSLYARLKYGNLSMKTSLRQYAQAYKIQGMAWNPLSMSDILSMELGQEASRPQAETVGPTS